LHEKLISGLRSFATVRLVTQGISWLGTIYVIRVLDSHAFGEFGVALVIFNCFSMVFDGTLLEALVQLPPETSAELRSAFTLLAGCGLVTATVTVAASGEVARVMGDSSLRPLACAVAAALMLTSLCTLPQAALARQMAFPRLALIAAAQGLGVTACTVLLAWLGAGVWALASGLVVGAALRLVLLNGAAFRLAIPTLHLRPAAAYLKLGGVLFADNMLWRWYTSIDTLLLGRWAGTNTLGFYTLAQQIAELPLEKISTVVNDVSLPAYSKLSQDRRAAASLMLETIRSHAVLGFPIFWGLASVAPVAVAALFGAKWAHAVFPLAALAAVAPLRLLGSVETPAMTGLGCPEVLLRSKYIVAPSMTAALAAGAWLGGINGAATAWLVAFPICYGIAFRLVLAAARVPYVAVLRAIRGPAVAAALMAAVVCLANAAWRSGLFSAGESLVGEVLLGVTSYPLLLRAIDGNAYHLAQRRLWRILGLRQPA
jgi:teichuronic acid exporter